MTAVKGTVTTGGHTFRFQEESFGTNRGITMSVNGVAQSQVTYKLNPNPHDLRAYNKNQEKFYKELATQLAPHYVVATNHWPAPGALHLTVLTEAYNLVAR
jgi:hypothetical protein